jgi:hypothetical protein
MTTVSEWLFGPASTNLRVVLYALVNALVLLLLARAVRAVWVQFHSEEKNTTEWIAKAPTTNLRILNGIALANLFVVIMLVAIVLGRPMDFDNLMTLGGFILIQMGLDVAQFGWKRSTFKTEAMGLTRESAEPAPPSPAAQVVQETGAPPAVEPAPPPVVDKIPGSGD